MDYGISGRTALVLGAGGGLGSAVCEALAREGVRIVAAGRSAGPLQATLARLQAIGATATTRVWDLGDLDAVPGHLAAIEAEAGPVDILFNNTGGPPPTKASWNGSRACSPSCGGAKTTATHWLGWRLSRGRDAPLALHGSEETLTCSAWWMRFSTANPPTPCACSRACVVRA